MSSIAEEVKYPVTQGCVDVEILEPSEESERVDSIESGAEVHEQDASICVTAGVQVMQNGEECQIDSVLDRSILPVGELVRVHHRG